MADIELEGSLITVEFTYGGRVLAMWAKHPSLPAEREDFQFHLTGHQFGDESTSDYSLGTVLLGIRTDPNEPWIVSRNQAADMLATNPKQKFDSDDALELFGSREVNFVYEFPLLDDIEAEGTWYEITDGIPQIAWDFTLRNAGRRSVEVGEVGFPMAFPNIYDGFGWDDPQLTHLWHSRVYVHKYIGGAASWVYAQRMNSMPPGLLVTPSGTTGWEFYSHVPGSLSTPNQWEGIITVYAHSKATVEREGWPNWSNDHTSVILEPGDSRTFSMRFMSVESDKPDALLPTLDLADRPAVRIFPSAVLPTSAGALVEISGTPARNCFVDREAELETRTEENQTLCYVRPRESGPIRLSVEDQEGRLSHVHLNFIEPIEQLIKKRAAYIAEHQRVNQPDHWLHQALAMTHIGTNEPILDAEEYERSAGIEAILADALYLTEKNAHVPVASEITAIDRFIEEFLFDDLVNPGSFSVASRVEDEAAGPVDTGRPMNYPHVFNLLHSASGVSKVSAGLTRSTDDYLVAAGRVARSFFSHGWWQFTRRVGILGFPHVYRLIGELRRREHEELASELEWLVVQRARTLASMQTPYAGESAMDASGFEDVVRAAQYVGHDEMDVRAVLAAYAARSQAPSWWWYGSDKRCWDGTDAFPLAAVADHGELCLSHTTIPNSSIILSHLDRDSDYLSETHLRMACAGMLGPWALVLPNGAASMAYCPDLASKSAGFSAYTGASGLGYFHYLREMQSLIILNTSGPPVIFGCDLADHGTHWLVTPWDGVGRRIRFRHIGFSIWLSFGRILDCHIDKRRRWFRLRILSEAEQSVEAQIMVQGLWGAKAVAGDNEVESDSRGWFTFEAMFEAKGETIVEGKVC